MARPSAKAQASIVGEAMLRLALTSPVLEKFGGDSIDETRDNLERAVAAASALFDKISAPNASAE